ncbi:hypothetical protein V5O48_007831 [Marasmius crinis-equi]|uniref:Glycoside-hydrolase family GH114 TIM-barrel domain-containing protein n=1 Tax=Marasmius crinis-equi TaxID=585013 RepID=A0ABR3FFJ8_9AGAR
MRQSSGIKGWAVDGTYLKQLHQCPDRPPSPNGKFDFQIGGAYPPASDVAVVTRHRADSPVLGKYNICYVNAFQTQDGEQSFWQSSQNDHLLLRKSNGQYFGHFHRYQAARTRHHRQRLDRRMPTERLQRNLDTFTRTNGLLSESNNLAYAKLLADHAHSIGLAIGQKNAGGELEDRGKTQVGFDFAVAEQCQEFDECDAYTDVYGNQVLEIEYDGQTWEDACRARGSSISIIYRDVDVSPRGSRSYVYQEC